MKTKTITREKIKQIHVMLDAGNTHAEIMRDLDVSLRQVTYQVSFRPQRQTITQLAKKAGMSRDAIYKRKQRGMSLEQALTHQKAGKV
jgi:DNA-binding phage protein